MVVEVIVIAVLVVFLLRNFTRPQFNQPPDPRHSPTHRQKEHQPAPLDFRLEVGQKVEEVEMVKTTLPVSLNMSEKALQPYKTKTQVSPTPSLADSSSSGCESAFSFQIQIVQQRVAIQVQLMVTELGANRARVVARNSKRKGDMKS
jgi:hypothetical protein